ncbi:A24 family peptidase [Plastoroseomonas arctica]|uniref:Prepilin peptidase n=1 Tax=Plastoroseomonas arctica TaxID=1509237 RepID=A0AAF1JUI5_9PROT|nr:A24 family peptidase [Plastoroseomonas arctica]MBR0653941.1 prepilin peptidase [Plastoroseomonas arctica]
MMLTLLPLIMPLALVLLIIAALHDIVVRLIPNWLSVAILCLGLVLRIGAGDWAWSLFAAVMVFALCVMAWRFALLGGGDVKLLAAVTTLVPAWDVAALIAAIALAGGALALLFILLRRIVPAPSRVTGQPRRGLARIWRMEARRIRRGGPLPYAVAIAAGTLWVTWGAGMLP